MYFFFYYFLAEINPLTILLLSTYIRPQKPTTYSNYRTEIHNPAPTPAPSSTIFRTPRSNHSFLRSKTNLKEDELRQGVGRWLSIKWNGMEWKSNHRIVACIFLRIHPFNQHPTLPTCEFEKVPVTLHSWDREL